MTVEEAAEETPHEWVETEAGCEDCGSHPAVRCVADHDCEYETAVDLVFGEDPRE